MTLLQSWIDSIQLLKPKNLKLFALVTLKSIGETYRLYFKYFWWLLLLYCVISGYRLFILNARDMHSLVVYAQITGVMYILYTFLFMGICFITRPTITQKDSSYLFTHYKRIILYWIIWTILFSISAKFRLLTPFFLVNAYSAGYIFSILFFADSSGGPKNFFLSIWYALKMIIFNLPLLFLVGFFFYCSEWFFFQCIKRIIVFAITEENVMAQTLLYVRIITNSLAALLMPIGICTYANIYIKKVHDQFDLYFKA